MNRADEISLFRNNFSSDIRNMLGCYENLSKIFSGENPDRVSFIYHTFYPIRVSKIYYHETNNSLF